ncbi:hypothetical protein E2C01_083230 [Portunus trituberculatus]|uniref:Uncharacterized protein n=1 Tax=Portunus trituberculatus TaxID=210409 RepID=A0A5B7J167_PORTR|nr:hypothetical protein [Portunus trituberculatus]
MSRFQAFLTTNCPQYHYSRHPRSLTSTPTHIPPPVTSPPPPSFFITITVIPSPLVLTPSHLYTSARRHPIHPVTTSFTIITIHSCNVWHAFSSPPRPTPLPPLPLLHILPPSSPPSTSSIGNATTTTIASTITCNPKSLHRGHHPSP